jgi:hypothetical protein
MAFISISMADLMTIPAFPEAYGNNDQAALKDIFYNCGVDVNKEYDWHHCTHRRISGEIVTCDRLEGKERIDREWIESGYASYETKVDSYPDLDFRVELRRMMHVSCIDTAFNQ